jgi:hypothetical protein
MRAWTGFMWFKMGSDEALFLHCSDNCGSVCNQGDLFDRWETVCPLQSVTVLVRFIITGSLFPIFAVSSVQNNIGLQRKLTMYTVKADKSLNLTQYQSVSLCVRRQHHRPTAAVLVKVVTDRNVCWWTVLWSRFQGFLDVTPCRLVSV